MWKLLFESVIGTSHQRNGTPCQDSSFATPLSVGEDELLIVACSDGAGSAEWSQVGSQQACQSFVHSAASGLTSASLRDLDRDTVLSWYQDVHAVLLREAESRAVETRQLACTLLTAIIGPSSALFAQVGDGSIVTLTDGSYDSVFWPQTGEYANTTNFITQQGFATSFEFAVYDRCINEVALFTDGLQRLALSFSSRSVHQAFFEPMFRSLRSAVHADELAASLRAFLGSAAVNERTDDDKTLVLATRVGSDGRSS